MRTACSMRRFQRMSEKPFLAKASYAEWDDEDWAIVKLAVGRHMNHESEAEGLDACLTEYVPGEFDYQRFQRQELRRLTRTQFIRVLFGLSANDQRLRQLKETGFSRQITLFSLAAQGVSTEARHS